MEIKDDKEFPGVALAFFLALLPFYLVLLAKHQPVRSPCYTAPHASTQHDTINVTIAQEVVVVG